MPEKALNMEGLLMAYLEAVGAEICRPNPDYTGPNPYVPIEPIELEKQVRKDDNPGINVIYSRTIAEPAQ